MKTFRMIEIALFVISLCISACAGIEGPSTPNLEVIKTEIIIDTTITTNGLSFTNNSGEQSISFTTNQPWTLSIAATTSGETWCTPSAISGAKGTANIKFTVKENTSYDNRSVSVTIKSGTASKTFIISQKCADALLITTDKYEVSQDGGTIEIEVKANINYKMEISESAKSWITESSTKALKVHKHTLNIASSEEAEKREGKIYFKSGAKTDTVKVYQTGGAIILLTENEYTVSSTGDTISVDIKSNIDFGVQMPNVDWITDESSTRGMSSHALKFIISPNEDYDSRTAEIIFYDKSSDLKDTLKIVQAQKNAIVIPNNYINVGAKDETIEVKINTNVDFEVQIPSDVTWISQVENTRALSESSFHLNIAPNLNDECRNASISIINKENKLSDTLFIIQHGNKTAPKISHCSDQEELEGWEEGIFGGDGTYILGKTYGNDGYLMTIGNILQEKGAIIFMDQFKQVREIFIDSLVFIFEDGSDGRMNISIIENGNEGKGEYTNQNSANHGTRSYGDNGQKVGIINLMMNLQGMYDAVAEIAGNNGFSKKSVIMFLANHTDSIRNLIKALGGPDIFNETFSDWLGYGMNVVSLAELAALYKVAGKSSPAGACILAYTGLYTTYLELYDEYIETFFGNCQIKIEDITVENYSRLNIDVNISGYEPLYNNIEYGVIVQEKSFPSPRYSSGLETYNVSQNGLFSLVKEDVNINKTYYCRPFLIDKDRTPLWKGFIGDIVGPLVRYGKVKSVTIDIDCHAETGRTTTIKENSAIVKCSYCNVNGLKNVECGVCVINTETYETKEIPTNNEDGEHEINITNLKPATTYSYRAYIKHNNIIIKEGESKSFTTLGPPKIIIQSIDNITSTSARINIKYENITPESKCQITYESMSAWLFYLSNKQETLNIIGDGSTSVTINNLFPDASYSCCIIIDNKWDNERKYFTTDIHPSIKSIVGRKMGKTHINKEGDGEEVEIEVYITDVNPYFGWQWYVAWPDLPNPFLNYYNCRYSVNYGAGGVVNFYVDQESIGFNGFITNSLDSPHYPLIW